MVVESCGATNGTRMASLLGVAITTSVMLQQQPKAKGRLEGSPSR
jgi:hypothetical protein